MTHQCSDVLLGNDACGVDVFFDTLALPDRKERVLIYGTHVCHMCVAVVCFDVLALSR